MKHITKIVERRDVRVIESRHASIRPRGGKASTGLILLFVLATACCAWVLWLPAFPSQDGPVHVYYARVARDLLLGGKTYAGSFRVARPFPPYSVHAYVLMALLPWTSGQMAEKLLACLAVISCAVGVAALSRQTGKAVMLAAFAAPFLLNRFLFFGFYGYNLGIGLALVAMAVWISEERTNFRRRVLFVALMALTMFAHPVPYLVALAFCWIELAAGYWNSRRAERVDGELARPRRGDSTVMGLASGLLLYIAHYAHSGGILNFPPLSQVHHNFVRLLDVFRTWDELPLIVPLYNWAIGAALVLASVLALWQSVRESRSGKITRTQLVAGFALMVLIGMPFLPSDMNGSAYFAERFAIFPPLLLIAASCGANLRQNAKRVIGAAAVVVCAVALFTLNAHLGPIARNVDASAVPPQSLRGVHLLGYTEMWTGPEVNYYPYLWSHVRVVDRSGALLVTAPWLDLQIMMLDDIGPKARITPADGPEYRGGPHVPVGMISERCNLDGGGIIARTIAAHPQKWSVQRYGCFNVMLPAR